MFGTIRKHQGIAWAIILLTCISMVAFFSQTQFSGGSGSANYGSIDGERVSRQDYERAYREAYIRFVLNTRPDNRPQFNEIEETYYQLFMQRKLREFNIDVDSESVVREANRILRQFGENGQAIPVDVFVEQVLGKRASVADFERFVRHQLGIQQLVSVLGLSGDLVTMQEAQALFERDRRELVTEAVFFSASNHLAAIPDPPAEILQDFYNRQMANYRIPDRRQVSYVKFPMDLARAESTHTNIALEVDANLERLGTNYTRFGSTPEEAKKGIRDEMLRQYALTDSFRKANEFLYALMEIEPVKVENLAALAQTNGLTVQVSNPFDQVNGPAEFDGGPNFASVAFSLSESEPIADQPLVGSNAVYVIALHKTIPNELQPLESIKEKVLADYKKEEAAALAREAGAAFIRAATNGMAQGKTFSAVAAEAKVPVIKVPPFSMRTQELPAIENYVMPYLFRQRAFSTPAGKVSDLGVTENGAFAVYVREELPVNEAAMRAELPIFLQQLRHTRRQEAFQAWLQREAEKSLQDTPLARPRTGPEGTPPARS